MPGEGIEPPTNGLQNRCSTAELTRLEMTAISVAALPQVAAARGLCPIKTAPLPEGYGASEGRMADGRSSRLAAGASEMEVFGFP